MPKSPPPNHSPMDIPDRETFFGLAAMLESIGWKLSTHRETRKDGSNGWVWHFIQRKSDKLQIGRISIYWKDGEIISSWLKLYGVDCCDGNHELTDSYKAYFNIRRFLAGKPPISDAAISEIEKQYVLNEKARIIELREKFNKPHKRYKFRSKYRNMLPVVIESV